MEQQGGSERRRAQRVPTYVAVEINSSTRKGRIGVSRDANGRGILVATPTRFEVGEEVELDLYLSKQKKIVVKGHVRRVETTDDLPHELWRYRLGIEFDGVEEAKLN